MEHFECKFDIKETTDAGIVEGYGSVFGNVDQGADVVERGAFAESLKDRGMPAMLWSHDPRGLPLGKWTDAKEDSRGLHLRGQLLMDTEGGRHMYAALKANALSGLSIGYVPQKWEVDAETDVRHLKTVDLLEVSFVNFPMNRAATVTRVKSGAVVTPRQLEAILRDAGFSAKDAKAVVSKGYAGLPARDAEQEDEALAQAMREFSQLLKV